MNQPTRITIDHPAAGPATAGGAAAGANATTAAAPAPHRISAFDLIASQPWAITRDALTTISAIARRENEAPEAVEARLGRPLQNARAVTLRGSTALVPVTGPVFRYANLFTEVSGATSLDVLARDLQAAQDDPNVKQIVLVIDSPGGQANGIAEFAAQVRAATKPVTAYVDGTAASAAYWIASAAKDIVVSKTGMVGSIGAVVAIDTNRSRPGVVEIVSAQSPKKRPDASTDEGRAQIQALIDGLAQVFVEDVAAHRRVSVDTVLAQFGQGDMILGADAVKRGMADRIGTLEQLLAELNASHSTPKGNTAMTLDDLRAAHPDLLAEHKASVLADEHARVAAVRAQSLPGHEALIEQLAADGTTTGPMAAVAVLAAERAVAAGRASVIVADAPAPVAHAAAPEAAAAAAPQTLDEKIKAKWDSSPALQAEFSGNFANFAALEKADAAGQVRILSGNK